MQILARWKVQMFRNFIIFKRELQHTLHKSFSLENVGPGIWSLKGIWENRGRISGVSSGRISGVRSSRISGVGGRISRVGRHMVSLTISISIVESLMLIGMAVYSIVPRFRVGLSISFTVGFSFTFHNMDSTTWVCIISAFEINKIFITIYAYESQNMKGNVHTCCNCMVSWNGHCMVVERIEHY